MQDVTCRNQSQADLASEAKVFTLMTGAKNSLCSLTTQSLYYSQNSYRSEPALECTIAEVTPPVNFKCIVVLTV